MGASYLPKGGTKGRLEYGLPTDIQEGKSFIVILGQKVNQCFFSNSSKPEVLLYSNTECQGGGELEQTGVCTSLRGTNTGKDTEHV